MFRRLESFATILGFIVMVALCLMIVIGLAGVLGLILEDNFWFNCHVNGNMVCGPNTPWHGFVNF